MSDLLVITGAPGSGKSTAAQSLLSGGHDFCVLDIDWLIDQGSNLIGARIQDSPNAWQPWSQLWFEVLHSVVRNHLTPIFFCPNTPQDFAEFGMPNWCEEMHWLLLDCENSERRQRLQARHWSNLQIDAALADAIELRSAVPEVLDTGKTKPNEMSAQILTWARSKSRPI